MKAKMDPFYTFVNVYLFSWPGRLIYNRITSSAFGSAVTIIHIMAPPTRLRNRCLRFFFSPRFKRRRLPFITLVLVISIFLICTRNHSRYRYRYRVDHRDCGSHVRLAFSIQASASSADRVARLLGALWDPCNFYAVHFDANMAPASRTAISTYLTERYTENLVVVPSRAVTYAGVTMLLATLDCITALLELSRRNRHGEKDVDTVDGGWDFFINLSANDYPLLSPIEVRRVLSNSRLVGLNFFQPQTATNDGAWFFSRRFSTVHFDPSLWTSTTTESTNNTNTNANNKLHKSPPDVITHPFAREDVIPLRKAEGWVILSRAFARYSVSSADSRTLLALFANTRASDEHYFPTLQAMSMSKGVALYPAVWDAMRHIAWSNGTHMLGRPAWLDGALGSVLRGALFESGALFARKFHGVTGGGSALLDEIDCVLSDLPDSCAKIQGSNSNSNMGWRADASHLERVKRRIGCIIESRGQGGARWMIEDCLNG